MIKGFIGGAVIGGMDAGLRGTTLSREQLRADFWEPFLAHLAKLSSSELY
jgi:hypothetical protein